MKLATSRSLSHVGALALLAAVLAPLTYVFFGFLRRALHPASGSTEFLLVLGSFVLAFLALVIVVAIAAPVIALSIGYIQHVKETRRQSPEVREALEVIRRADAQGWSFDQLASIAPSLAVRVGGNRWLLGEGHFKVARQLGEQEKDSVPLCGGCVFDVLFSRPVSTRTLETWRQLESKRKQCPYKKGRPKRVTMDDGLAELSEEWNQDAPAREFWVCAAAVARREVATEVALSAAAPR